MSQMISYAQNGEDIILNRLFGGQLTGFYIDIGASHPKNLSVTKHFYDKGWKGINIDPLRASHALFAEARPRDINLSLAIDSENGVRDFYEVTSYPELSTFSKDIAEQLTVSGQKITSYSVSIITGNELFNKHVHEPVDFMKIDVEGFEYQVISSIDFRKHRPKVLVIEATIPNAAFPGWQNLKTIDNYKKWEDVIVDSGYLFAYFDGLNRFYIREENRELLAYFQVGLCLWDHYYQYPPDSYVTVLEWHCAERMKQINTLTALLNTKWYRQVFSFMTKLFRKKPAAIS